ncbi:LTA synthase family protein [Trichloromonas sp.]|uniref:LTA synthase family protein n=1 Tax=Trichloromonas sp. TaxID=3069249 RepID=UPI002A460E18|nr:LTA synthase family protein [Trichloromonas sp.]
MFKLLAYLSLLVLTLTPFFRRLALSGGGEYIGLLSDAGVGLLLLVLLVWAPRPVRILLALLWTAFMIGAHELVAAMNRLPTWQDLHYLTNPDFVQKSASGFNFSAPGLVWPLAVSALLVAVLPLARPRLRYAVPLLAVGVAILGLHTHLSLARDDLAVIPRHNALHWFIIDTFFAPPPLTAEDLANFQLPSGLDRADLDGSPLMLKGKAKNVLIITLEGIPGLYHPEIRQAMGVRDYDKVTMTRLAESTPGAMLIPDFTVHSHQTIRGLYALLCGDFSKQSWSTAKAVELSGNPQRAAQCLPAQLAAHGWENHYLQGAGLAFMGKDRFMPLIGFDEVHGSEWFTEPNPYPFEWGAIDAVLFRGARAYIADLRKKEKPWMLTLLTVGTHQPYAVPDEIVARYPDRRAATVDQLDQALGRFIDDLRADGVLEDTLVIIASDESHGAEIGDWTSSWGLGMILAPEDEALPRLKPGGYGLVDTEISILDYLGLPVPEGVIGRSFFRDYETPREMVAFTASKRRRHTADNLRYECSDDGRCRVGKADSLLGPPPAEFTRDTQGRRNPVFLIDAALDRKLLPKAGARVLDFADGEIRSLPEKIRSEWSDTLVGAQGLDFPANSRVHVSIRVKMLQAPPEGVQLKLILKMWEHTINSIPYPEFPVLRAQEEGTVEFFFDNPEERRSFSFHLIGEGKDAIVQMEEFKVSVEI